MLYNIHAQLMALCNQILHILSVAWLVSKDDHSYRIWLHAMPYKDFAFDVLLELLTSIVVAWKQVERSGIVQKSIPRGQRDQS